MLSALLLSERAVRIIHMPLFDATVSLINLCFYSSFSDQIVCDTIDKFG